MDLDGKPVQKRFKPSITQPKRFKGGTDRDHYAWADVSTILMEGSFHHIGVEDTLLSTVEVRTINLYLTRQLDSTYSGTICACPHSLFC